MEENEVMLEPPRYKKPDTLKAVEILLGIEEEESNEKAGNTKTSRSEESQLIVKARELRATLDLLIGEKEIPVKK